jgi:hypothetical protein
MAVWNPFDTTTGAFNLIELADAINRRLTRIGQLGGMNLVQSRGVSTLKVAVEQMTEGNLGLLTPIARGAPAPQITKDKRTIVDLESVRIAAEDTIFADSLQGVRVFGTEGQARALEEARNESLDKITARIDATYEHHLLGMVQGIVKNPAGTTILNCYTALGQSQAGEVNLELDEATDETKTPTAVQSIVRATWVALGALGQFGLDHIHCLTDATGFNNLINSLAFRNSYKYDSVSAMLRDGAFGRVIRWQGVEWEEYRLGNSGYSSGSFIGTGKFIFFPVFTSPESGIYKVRWVPSDSLNDLNEVGLPRYVKVKEDREYSNAPRWIGLMGEMNPLVYCTYPAALQRGDDGVS